MEKRRATRGQHEQEKREDHGTYTYQRSNGAASEFHNDELTSHGQIIARIRTLSNYKKGQAKIGINTRDKKTGYNVHSSVNDEDDLKVRMGMLDEMLAGPSVRDEPVY